MKILKVRYPRTYYKYVKLDVLDHPPVAASRYNDAMPWLDWVAGQGYDDVEIIDACGIGTGWGPWVCPLDVGHAEHRCRCGQPGTALCSYSGMFVCGIPHCDDHQCPVHG